MLKQFATVVDTQPGIIVLRLDDGHNGCASCHSACSALWLKQLFQSSPVDITINCHNKKQIGERITVGILESPIVKACLLVYLLPIMMMIAFSLLAGLFTTTEVDVVLSALIGFSIGWLFAKYFFKRYLLLQLKIEILENN